MSELFMVNEKNKQTFSPPRVGEVSNLAGAECTIILKSTINDPGFNVLPLD